MMSVEVGWRGHRIVRGGEFDWNLNVRACYYLSYLQFTRVCHKTTREWVSHAPLGEMVKIAFHWFGLKIKFLRCG
jgi:hypothetical protein